MTGLDELDELDGWGLVDVGVEASVVGATDVAGTTESLHCDGVVDADLATMIQGELADHDV